MLKTVEELKEFVENIGVEYRFACLHEKEPEGCQLLGDYFEAAKLDFPNAAKVYKANCDDNNHPRSCFKYGRYSLIGRGCDEDPARAIQYLKKGCELNFPDSCLISGQLLTSEKNNADFENNVVEGLNCLNKACAANIAVGCFAASQIYERGTKHVEKDFTKAFELGDKACRLDHMYACANVGKLYRNGDGVEKNEKLAAEYINKAKEIRRAGRKSQGVEYQQHT